MVKKALMQVVPTYHTPEEVNENAIDSEEMRIASGVYLYGVNGYKTCSGPITAPVQYFPEDRITAQSEWTTNRILRPNLTAKDFPILSENYPAIRITVLNRSEGKIDEIVIRFRDHWASKDTIHAWTYRGESEWYNYHPTTADYTKIAKAITDYLENFTD